MTIKNPLGRIVLRLSAVSGGTITLNEGMGGGGSMTINIDGYEMQFGRVKEYDTEVSGVKYYAYELYGMQYYTTRNTSGVYSNEPFYGIAEDGSMIIGAYGEITIVVNDEGDGPTQKVIMYTAGDNQEFELDTSVATLKNEGTGLKYIEIPEGTKEIVTNSFQMAELTGITMHDGLETIGTTAFFGCSGLTVVDIPDTVTEIQQFAFYGCYSLTDLKLPKNLVTIGYGAFYSCTHIGPNIVIPNKVTTIADSAFMACHSIETITLPNGLTSISTGLFNGCSNLVRIIYKGTKAQWNALPKGEQWLPGWDKDVTVQCTDGNIVYPYEDNIVP